MLAGDGGEEARCLQADTRTNRGEHVVAGDIRRVARPVRFEHGAGICDQIALLLRIKGAAHGFYAADRMARRHLGAHPTESRPVLHILDVVIQAPTVAVVKHCLAGGVDLLVDRVKHSAHENGAPANGQLQPLHQGNDSRESEVRPGARAVVKELYVGGQSHVLSCDNYRPELSTSP